MPSTGSDVGLWKPLESLPLLGMAVVFGLLLVESAGMGIGAAGSRLVVFSAPLIALSVVYYARRSGAHCLHMSVFMVILGSIGLLIGARLDFGALGLVTLTGWCSVLPAFSLDAVWSKLLLAPCTYFGMLAGCNLGMLLSAHLTRQSDAKNRHHLLHYAACNTGMILGMFLAEALASHPLPGTSMLNLSAVAGMYLFMILGMTAGMWAGWWTAEWALRR